MLRLYRVLFWSWLLLSKLGALVLLMLLSCCEAGVLREAVGLLGIGYCVKLLSCCEAGVLREAVGC